MELIKKSRFALTFVLICMWFLPWPASAQTLLSYDSAGNRSAEVSNQPITAPVITGQPQTLLGQIGGTYSFTVTASGANLSYRWYKDTTAISGATSDTLIITNAQSGDFSNHSATTGMYSVVVSNSAGSVTSNSAALYLDTNGVGVPDWWQVQYFGSTVGFNPGATPYDNGITNLMAYQEGLDPTSAATEGYALNVSGPVSVQPRQASYAPGTTVTLSVPNGMLVSWTGDAGGSANPLTITMDRSKSITANTGPYVNTHFGATLSSRGYSCGINSLLLQANGQIVAAGWFDTFLGIPQGNLGRINANGTVDPNYFPLAGTAFISQSGGPGITDMAQQPDGKIIVVGSFSHSPPVNGANPPSYIARFNTDGTLDESFMANGQYPNATVSAVAVQSDGHIVIGGNFSQIGSAWALHIARLNSDGSVDTSFGVGASSTSYNNLSSSYISPGCVQVDASDNIYVGGFLYNYNGTNISHLIRLTSTGSLDTGFSSNIGFDSSVTCFVQRPGGGLYVGGAFQHDAGTVAENVVALASTGTIDTTFNAGSTWSGRPTRMLLLPSGELMVGINNGYWQAQNLGFLIRLYGAGDSHGGGTVDSAFSLNLDSVVNAMVSLPSGDVLLGGSFTSVNGQPLAGLVELTSSGSLDTSVPPMNIGTASSNVVDVAAQQNDGKLIVDGRFNLVNGTTLSTTISSNYSFARLNTDGSVDTTFNAGTGPNVALSGIVPLTSGKTFIYGFNLTQYNGQGVFGCALIDSNGGLIYGFPGCLSGNVFGAALQSNQNIVVVNNSPAVQRLTSSTGTLDSSFHSPTIAGGLVEAVAVDSQDRIIIGGSFTSVDGNSVSGLARLASTGSFDPTFAPPAQTGTVTQVACIPGGQIVASGKFSTVGGTTQHGLAVFTSSGALIPLAGTSAIGNIQSIGVQSDGGIVVGTLSGAQPLYRLLPDGAVDPSFNPGLNSSVNDVVIGNNDDIFALGSFTTDASNYAAGIAHYSPDPHLNLQMAGTIPTGTVTAGTPITLYGMASTSGGSIASVDFLYSSDGINFQAAATGNSIGSGEYSGIWAPPTAGTFYLRLAAADTTGESGLSRMIAYTATGGSPSIATPTLSLSAGTYSSSQFVSVSDTSVGVQIYYTLDGSDPATSATRIFLGTGGIIPIWQSANLKVEAFYGSGISSLVSASYTISSSLSAIPTGAPSYYPSWWFTRGVIKQTGTPVTSPVWPANYPVADDFAVINQGQLKNLATQAYAELAAVLPPTAWSTPQGQTLSSFVSGLSPTGGDAYSVVNLGQLKTVAQPFYDLLKQQSLTTGYPWTGSGADDYSVANIGQAKNVFNSVIP